MTEGYWLNYKSGKVVQIYEHERDIRHPAIARQLGVPAKVFSRFAQFAIGVDRCRFLRWLMARVPLVRVRQHRLHDSYEASFSGRSRKEVYAAIVKFTERQTPPDRFLNIANLRTGKSEQIIASLLWARESKHRRKYFCRHR